ncbi:hypothetical protein SporoP37_02195 [Sporosarcina sp. P37]|uniref:hypothetical protein n=1 Tax=unclassified Sporosarcina TaxID=2647733 RepID=UPI000A17D3A7|nr:MULTISPECIES: hypothetical protein [unclassified Sporosarcina]ARK23617.1 hypothetical protein SporoP37_02195 [Sporosarcina sp. P37]PID18760.1 hypothetical protein CSV62_06555 [Sporosarcina sp. P35]
MKNKNSAGYALIIVLFAIVFITVLTSVLMRGSLSNFKQDQRVEESDLTTTAAEAGVDYYTWELEDAYNSNKPSLISYADGLVEKGREGGRVPDYTNIQKLVAEKLKGILVSRAESFTGKEYSINEYWHEIQPEQLKIEILASKQPISVAATGKVQGYFEGEYPVIKELEFEQRFFIPSFQETPVSNSIVTGQVVNVPKWIDANKPKTLCTNKSKIESSCYAGHQNDVTNVNQIVKSKVYVDKQFNSKKAMKLEDNSDLFVKEDFKVDKLELQSQSRVLVGKDLDVQSNEKNDTLELEDASYLYVDRDLKVNGGIKLQNSSIVYIGRKAQLKGDIELENASSLFVGNVLDTSGTINLQNNSKICAAELKIKHAKLDLQSGVIYYLNGIDVDIKKVNPKNFVKVNSMFELKKSCGFASNPTDPPLSGNDTWDDPVIEKVVYKK